MHRRLIGTLLNHVVYSGVHYLHYWVTRGFHHYVDICAHRVTLRHTAIQDEHRDRYRWGHDKVLSGVGSFRHAFRHQ